MVKYLWKHLALDHPLMQALLLNSVSVINGCDVAYGRYFLVYKIEPGHKNLNLIHRLYTLSATFPFIHLRSDHEIIS